MKSSDHDEQPLRSALRSGPTRSPNRVSFSLEAGPACGGGVVYTEQRWRGAGVSPPLGLRDTEPMERRCRLLALSSALIETTQHTRDISAVDQWGLSSLRDGPGLNWSHSRTRPWQSRVVAPGGGGVSQMSAVLGELLELVEQHWTGPRSLQRNTAFLGRAYDLLLELMEPSRGGASQDKSRVMFKPTSVNSEVMLLRKRLERSEQQLERMKKGLVVTLKENYELKRQRD